MFRYGVDYYPEHWSEERWATDARLMREARMNVVRLAEFAWASMEPEPDRHDFGWLDRAIAILNAEGIDVILGTPTASPPPWLMSMYPDAFLMREDGQRMTYGGRREYCPNHESYRRRAAAITEAMAAHYAGHAGVIGWQIDNEFGDRCYCPICQQRFHDWLQAKYQTLDALNACLGTVFWSHTYTDWSQIPTPQTGAVIHNPGLHLDYLRFMSDSYVDLQKEQVDILRARCPGQFITHNLMGFQYDKLNYFDLARDLDFVSWDNYPRGFWISEAQIDPARLALGHVTMYGLRDKPFWVMEAQSGPAGWNTIGPTPRPGEIRLWAYQALAHGADGIVYFRWRTARFGAEQYWHGVLNHDGSAHRRYEEVRRMGEELERVGGAIAQSEARAECAMVLSYDSRFAFQIQPNNAGFSYPGHFYDYFAALHRRKVPAAIVAPEADLSRYKLVIVPALYIVDPAVARQLSAFVEAGGVLVITTRSGVKESSNTVVEQPLPGLLAELCGLHIHEYDSLLPGQTRRLRFANGGADGASATVWCDLLELSGAEALAYYDEDYYAGVPAVAVHRYGKGRVIYSGTVGNASLVKAVIDTALQAAGVAPLLDAPDGVEITARWKDGRRLLFLLNHGDTPATVRLDKHYTGLLDGEPVEGVLDLPAKEVLVLTDA